MFELLYTSSKEALPFSQGLYLFNEDFLFMKMWVCAHGICSDVGVPRIMKIFHDGTFIYLAEGVTGEMPNQARLLSRVNGRIAQGTYDTNYIYFHPVDQFVGVSQPFYEIARVARTYAPSVSAKRCFIDEEMGIYIAYYGTDKIRAYAIPTGEVLWTYTFLEGYGLTDRSLSWAWPGVIMAVNPTDGLVYFLEYRLDGCTLITSGKIEPCYLATFDSANKVILAIGTDNLLKVYYPKGVPNYFVGPTFNPVTITRFGVNELTVRLLGDGDEPCENWWINWTLDNDKGWLTKTHSKTDADGYAYNTYLAPVDVADIGAETVRVEVVI